MHAFEAETRFAERSSTILKREDATLEDMRREYKHIQQQYGVLLNEVMKITRVSDATQTELRRTRKELFLALQTAEQQRTTAERLNEQKTEILSIAAHDLKNPLSSIIGLAQVLREDAIAEEQKAEILRMIESSGERMLTLIQNLLSNSALELGKITPDFTECNLLTIASEVIIANTTRAQNKGQNITFHYDDAPFTLQGDTSLLYELCDNLLSNAVKYSPLNGTIAVSLKAITSEAQANHLTNIHFSVRDKGQGLSEHDKTNLFGYFQRLSAQPTGGESSHGVGLAIAKRITEIHQGIIRVESRADEGIPGATFIVELPVQSAESVR
jgi:signal transduction histidine kinase